MRVPEEEVPSTAERLITEVRALEPSLAARVDAEEPVSSGERATLQQAIASVIDRLHPPAEPSHG